MNRSYLIDRLKELRRSGVDIGIALTASTDVLHETWNRLRNVQQRRTVEEPSIQIRVHEGLWQVLLPKLQLRTLYRMILMYKEAHRVLNNTFWRNLIVRDLGVVPDFIDEYRLYYLKQMHFGVPLTLYGLDEEREHSLTELDDQVVFIGSDRDDYEYRVRLNNELRNVNDDTRVKLDLVGRSIKKMVQMGSDHFLLTTDGHLLSLVDGEGSTPYYTRRGTPVADIVGQCILLKSGEVYFVNSSNPGKRAAVPGKRAELPEPVVSINGGQLLMKSGLYYGYEFDITSNSLYVDKSRSGRYDREQYRLEFLSELDSSEHLIIDLNGAVVNESSFITHVYANIFTELGRYFMVQLYRADSQTYYYRGFKK